MMHAENIPITRPYFTEEDREALQLALDTGWVVQGPRVKEFESLFARLSGAPYALATSSCTAALHLVLVALGIGEGDEVLVPAFTFVASANVMEYVRARPRFVDIDLETFNLNIDRVERLITPKTRAILPVHLFGLSAEMAPLVAIARRHGLALIEDAACAVGSRYHGRHVGTFGDAGCFSFHARKVITTGEGGMVITARPELASTLEALRSHGATTSDLARHRLGSFALPEFNLLGFNYRMTDLQGALGVAQLSKLDWLLEQRVRLARRYDADLSEVPHLATPQVPEGLEHTYQSYVLFVKESSPLDRDELALRLQQRGIATRQGTHAVPLLGFYRQKYGYTPADFPRAWAADRRSLALPLYPAMTEEEQERVIGGIIEELRRCG